MVAGVYFIKPSKSGLAAWERTRMTRLKKLASVKGTLSLMPNTVQSDNFRGSHLEKTTYIVKLAKGWRRIFRRQKFSWSNFSLDYNVYLTWLDSPQPIRWLVKDKLQKWCGTAKCWGACACVIICLLLLKVKTSCVLCIILWLVLGILDRFSNGLRRILNISGLLGSQFWSGGGAFQRSFPSSSCLFLLQYS